MAPHNLKQNTRWVSNQEDTLKSDISDFVPNNFSLDNKKQRDHSSPSDLSLTANPKIDNFIKSGLVKKKLGAGASKFGNFVLDNIVKNVSISGSDGKSKSDRTNVIFNKIKSFGKKFKRRNRFVVSS